MKRFLMMMFAADGSFCHEQLWGIERFIYKGLYKIRRESTGE